MKSQYDPLNISIVHDRHGKPLAVVENFPGFQADMYSYDLRLIASALLEAADRLDAAQDHDWQPDPTPLDAED